MGLTCGSAYDFFKVELFDLVELPPCFVRLERKGSCTLGFFSANRFATTDRKIADEIALNPRHFKTSPFVVVMSTLVHEMVHQWQHHFGRRRSRSAYHNKEWAGEMLRLGLHPSHTGEPGGSMTGQTMSHYVIPADQLPGGLAGSDLIAPSRLSSRRTVCRCPRCGQRAGSNSTFFAICGHCEVPLERVGLR